MKKETKMKAKQLLTLSLAVLMVMGIVTRGRAGSLESLNIFESPGKKQTNKDFKPAPFKMKTNFGDLQFLGGGFPVGATAQKLYDELDLQRATQAYMDFMPALSVYGIIKGQIRDFGFKTASDYGVFADRMEPSELYLTGNDVSIYAVASLDLKVDGPTVVEVPPQMLGTANDAYFKYLCDFGPSGPDKAKGGKFLFLPPGYKGEKPDGYFVIHSPSYRIWAMMRGAPDVVGIGDKAIEWYKKYLKVYPLKTGPREFRAINMSGRGINSLVPEDGSAFEMLNEIIQYEPSELFEMEQLGRLASLGIVKGKSFSPDARMQRILDQGAKQGTAMARTIVYASRDPEIHYWPGKQWEKMFNTNTEFLRDGYLDPDSRTLWMYSAIVVSPMLISKTPGWGTGYITSFRDEDGVYLDGAKNYRLNVPANVPAGRFWAVTIYDPATRSLLGNEGPNTVTSLRNPEVNSNGSVDVYFGPKAPKGKENNWGATVPGKGWFVVFRFYGPLEGYIEKTWVLNDIELIK
jgi:hypothetical protein